MFTWKREHRVALALLCAVQLLEALDVTVATVALPTCVGARGETVQGGDVLAVKDEPGVGGSLVGLSGRRCPIFQCRLDVPDRAQCVCGHRGERGTYN